MLKAEIGRAMQSPDKSIGVTLDWVEKKFQRLNQLILSRAENIPLIRNDLLRLFPSKLTVKADGTAQAVEFHINGAASPFNWLLADNVQLCMASPRGFEPLLPP